MPWIAAAAVVVGAAISYAGASKQADATQAASEAQLNQANADRTAAMGFANMSSAQLLAQKQEIETQMANVQRQQSLLDAVDPAIKEAGKQALALLRGGNAQSLAPIQAERDRQRQNLVNQLQSQLGPGGLNSTAGQEALNRFDMQTSEVLAGAQQDTLKTLLGTSTANRPNPNALTESNSRLLSDLALPGQEQIAAMNKTPLIPYVGAPFVADAAQGAAISRTGSSLSQLGGTMLGASYAGGGGSTPTSPTSGNATLTPANVASTNYNSMQSANPYGYTYQGGENGFSGY